MPETERTQWDTPIPLRDNSSRGQPPQPNPWSRLEAVTSVRERMGWFGEHLQQHWETVSAAGVASVVEGLAAQLHAALWGDIEAVEAVRLRPERQLLAAAWDDSLDTAGPL